MSDLIILAVGVFIGLYVPAPYETAVRAWAKGLWDRIVGNVEP